MAFRLRKEAKEWFKQIRDDMSLDFDVYYLCLIAGLATGRKGTLENEEQQTTELVEHFPGDYREKGRVIVALFLSRELSAMGIKLSERGALNTSIAQLISPDSPHLSSAGMKEMNRYAYGGFEVLTEWFEEKPQAMETFLPLYKSFLDKSLKP